jgi:hypothetical protein
MPISETQVNITIANIENQIRSLDRKINDVATAAQGATHDLQSEVRTLATEIVRIESKLGMTPGR